MKGLILIAAVLVIVFVILGIPAFSYGATKKNANEIQITVSAYTPNSSTIASYGVTYSFFGNYSRPDYLSYVGQFWGKSLHFGSATITYPSVSIVIAKRVDLSNGGYRLDRIIPDDYTAYTYGTHFTKVFKLPVEPGEKIHVQVEISPQQSTDLGFMGKDIVVPTGV